MSQLINQLQALAASSYSDEEGEEQWVHLLPGLSNVELESFAIRLPNRYLPLEIKELLCFARGFTNSIVTSEEVRFDVIGDIGSDDLLLNPIELASNGAGDYWYLDINTDGQWGAVFQYYHEIPALIRHSDSLSDFLRYVSDSAKPDARAKLDNQERKAVDQVWQNHKKRKELIKVDIAKMSEDTVLRQFSLNLPAAYVIADLRKGSATAGFVCEAVLGDGLKAYKHETEPIWAVAPPQLGWFSRLFGR